MLFGSDDAISWLVGGMDQYEAGHRVSTDWLMSLVGDITLPKDMGGYYPAWTKVKDKQGGYYPGPEQETSP